MSNDGVLSLYKPEAQAKDEAATFACASGLYPKSYLIKLLLRGS
jgi:hypothetical protein